jgi:hypothetical protein
MQVRCRRVVNKDLPFVAVRFAVIPADADVCFAAVPDVRINRTCV